MPNDSPLSRIRKGRLVQVLAVYLGASWLVLQVARVLQEALALPAWVSPVAVLLLLIGLVVVLATAWVQSHPLAVERVEAEEVPGRWELAARELKSSVMAGRMPHLTWARSLLGGVAAFWLLFGFAGLYVVVKDRGERFLPAAAYAGGAGPGVAVVPFEVSGADLDLWREGMVDLLTRNLDGVGGLRAIASRTMLARWREAVPDGHMPDLPAVLELARRTDATYAVVGSAVAMGPRVRLGATVHELSTGRELARGEAEGAPDQVLNLVDELSLQLLRALLAGGAGQAVQPGRLASLTTRSIPALRAFLEGESLLRAADFRAAAAALERATAADSTFGLAHYRLGEAHGWLSGSAGIERRRHAAAALRFVDRLPARDASMLRAIHSLANERLDGLDTLRQLVIRYPDDADAWYHLGDYIWHAGPVVLVPMAEARRALGRALDLDPEFAPFYIHAIEVAIAQGDSARAMGLIETLARLDPSGGLLTQRLRIAGDFLFGDPGARRAARDGLGATDERLLGSVGTVGGPFALGLREHVLGELDRRAPGSRTQQLRATYLGRGKLGDAVRLMEGAPADLGLQLHVREAMAVGGTVPPQLVERAFAFLPADSSERNLLVAAHAADTGDWETFDRARAALRGMANRLSMEGDTAAARRHSTSDRVLEGYALWRRGRPDEAARVFRSVQTDPGRALGWAGAWNRWWAGQLMAGSETPAEAIPYLRSFKRQVALSHASYMLGDVYERIGQPDSARTAYATFLYAWADADPDLPLLLDAHERLRRLTTEP